MQPKRVLRERKCNIRERAIGAGRAARRRLIGSRHRSTSFPPSGPLRTACSVLSCFWRDFLRTLIEKSFSRGAFASDTYFCRDELSVGGKYPRV